MPIELAEEMN